jgi:hypothetical protein
MSIFERLERFVGKYSGEGLNHEGQPFIGEFSLSKSISSYCVHFKANGLNGDLYHEEQTTIALQPNQKPALWSVNTNNPMMLQHELRRELQESEMLKIVFGFGDLNIAQSFREEITLELHSNGDIGYRYSWGMPGGEFRERSGVRLIKQT